MFRFAYLAFRDLGHYRGRTALAITGIAVVVAVYFTLAGVAEGVGNIAGSVSSARNLILLDSRSLFPDDAALSPQVIQAAGQIAGVSQVVPMLYRHVRVGEGIVHLRATPLDSYRETHASSLVEGGWLGPDGGLLVGEGLAKLRGWQVGQTLDLAGERMTIVGLFHADEGIKNSEIWVSLVDGARILDRTDSYSMALALLTPEADAEAVRAALASHPELEEVNVFFEKSYFEQFNQALGQLQSVVQMVSAVALMAIVFGVFNVTSMNAAEKRREVGLLKAGGVTGGQVVGMFLVMGTALASLGFLAGLVLGGGIVAWLGASSAVNLGDVAIRPALTLNMVAFGAAVTLALGLAGAYLPARGAANVSVIDALRGV